jgi:hypothetical protein
VLIASYSESDPTLASALDAAASANVMRTNRLVGLQTRLIRLRNAHSKWTASQNSSTRHDGVSLQG